MYLLKTNLHIDLTANKLYFGRWSEINVHLKILICINNVKRFTLITSSFATYFA